MYVLFTQNFTVYNKTPGYTKRKEKKKKNSLSTSFPLCFRKDNLNQMLYVELQAT